MKRRLPDILLAVMGTASVLLILLICASFIRPWSVSNGWVENGFTPDEGMVQGSRTVAVTRGSLVWAWYGLQTVGHIEPAGGLKFLNAGFGRYQWSVGAPAWAMRNPPGHLGFDYTYTGWASSHPENRVRTAMFRVRIPLWAIALPFFAATAWLLVLHRRRRRRAFRRAKHLCESCGYDLRATPDLCPECGLVPGASMGPA